MKKLTLIAITLFTFALASCDGMAGKKVNSYDCDERFDVQLSDGSAMWIYNGSVYDGYVKGTDEQGRRVWVSLNNVLTITEVDCNNGN